jgi:hypothetical protein
VARLCLYSQAFSDIKPQVRQSKVRFIPYVVTGVKSTCKVNWLLKQLSYQSCDLGPLASGQGNVGKEWMAFKRLNHCNHAIMTAHPQVIPLGYVMGKDYPRALSDSREHSKQNTSLK